VLDNAVEVVDAAPANRSFPDRVNESLGICLKSGPAHDVRAAGRTLSYPSDAICVRSPGTVWSTRGTGPAAFVSIDVEPPLLPPGGLVGAMAFVDRTALGGLRGWVGTLRSDAATLDKEVAVTELVDAVVQAGLVAAPHLDPALDARAVSRARELLTSRLAAPPRLQELADAVGANRFVLLRSFRRAVGVPPHAFVLRLRVERARALLARGADISESALALGFADQSHLTRVFTRIVGLSPGAYRRQMRSVAPGSIAFKT
jgi:AraC-like DNA-binding protein